MQPCTDRCGFAKIIDRLSMAYQRVLSTRTDGSRIQLFGQVDGNGISGLENGLIAIDFQSYTIKYRLDNKRRVEERRTCLKLSVEYNDFLQILQLRYMHQFYSTTSTPTKHVCQSASQEPVDRRQFWVCCRQYV